MFLPASEAGRYHEIIDNTDSVTLRQRRAALKKFEFASVFLRKGVLKRKYLVTEKSGDATAARAGCCRKKTLMRLWQQAETQNESTKYQRHWPAPMSLWRYCLSAHECPCKRTRIPEDISRALETALHRSQKQSHLEG